MLHSEKKTIMYKHVPQTKEKRKKEEKKTFPSACKGYKKVQARDFQKVDNSIRRINHYPADRVVCFVNNYPLDSDLSGG